MFKKGEIVVYPRHGAGKITRVYKETLNGNEIGYYEIKFTHSAVEVALPQKKAEALGLRYPYSKKELLNVLKNLNKRVVLKATILADMELYTKEKLQTGKIEDAIDLINIIVAHSKKKQKENKKISFSESKNLEAAIKFVSSIVSVTLGERSLKKLGLAD